MTGYARKFDENTIMSFKVNKHFLGNYNKIWEIIEKLIKIDFGSKPVHSDDNKYIKPKIKTYAESIIKNFYTEKMPQQKAPCKCLSIIMLDSVIKENEKYYLQVQQKIKTENYIDEDLENVNQIVTVMIRQNLILIMMNMTNNLLKVFK